MTTATDIWCPSRDLIDGSVAASLAMDAAAWAKVEAPLAVVDRDPLGTTSLAVGEVDVDGAMTDFGVLSYSYDDAVSHLVVGGPYDHRPGLAVGVLRELVAAGLVRPDAVLEVVGLDEIPGDLQPPSARAVMRDDTRAAKRVVRDGTRAGKRVVRDASGSSKGIKRDRDGVGVSGIKKSRGSGRTAGVKRSRSIDVEINGVVRQAAAGRLTAGELAALALLADGRTTGEIATELSVLPATVRRTMRRISRKLGSDSPEALSAALAKR